MTPEEKNERLTLFLGIILVPLVIGVGIYTASWRSQEVDRRLRQELLTQSVEIAATIDPSLVRKLTFSATDIRNPAYQRIREQMIAYGQLIRQRGIYSEAFRKGSIVFGPENYPEGDPMGSGPPGTPYFQPDDVDFRVLRTGIPAVIGPASDEYGTFVSALAPVFDPVNGQVLMIVGIDILADEWEKEILSARITPLIIATSVILIQLACFILIYLRKKGKLRTRGPWRYLEVILVAFTGVVLTAAVTVVFHDHKKKEQELMFRLRNQTIVENLREDFRQVQKGMFILKDFIESNEVVTRSEFQSFTQSLDINFALCSFLWIHRDQSDPSADTLAGSPYNIQFHTPFPDFLMMDSTEIGWISGLNELFLESEQTEMIQSTVINLPRHDERKSDLLVTILQAKEGAILTILAITPFMEFSLLKSSLREHEISIEFMALTKEDDVQIAGRQPFYLRTPMFAFGRAFALITSPSAEFLEANLRLNPLGTVVPGLILTFLMTVFALFITNRHSDLARMVAIRSVELTQAKEKAEESDRLKSVFLANMSHEIRTPMNAIVGFSQVLAEPDLQQNERARLAEIIQHRSNDLLHIINDILDLSRIESGNVSCMISKVSLNTIIDELELVFREKMSRLNKKYISLRTDKPMKDEAAEVVTDPYILRQVYTNLIDNAIKFTSEGTIAFGYRAPQDHFFTFFVSDTGIGISRENQKIIFDHFRQADITGSHNHTGSGLGLAICQGFIHVLGGEIWVESVPGEGSTFLFTLPDKRMKDHGESDSLIKEPTVKEKSTRLHSWQGKRFILVEDDESNQDYLRTILRRTGAELICVSTARELKEHYNELDRIDLVLLDVRLPDGVGWKLVKEIKKIQPTLPVIIQTAYAMTTDQLKSEESGSDGYISKPIRKNELLNIIETVLKG